MTKEKNCLYFESLYLRFSKKLLTGDELFFAENHWENCEECNKNTELGELKEAFEIMGLFSDIEPSTDFFVRLEDKLFQLEERKKLFWLKVDHFFNLLRGPALAFILIIFCFFPSGFFNNELKKDLHLISLREKINSSDRDLRLQVIAEISIENVFKNISKLFILAKGVNS